MLCGLNQVFDSFDFLNKRGEKTEVVTRIGNSIDTDNIAIGYTQHRTRTNNTRKPKWQQGFGNSIDTDNNGYTKHRARTNNTRK